MSIRSYSFRPPEYVSIVITLILSNKTVTDDLMTTLLKSINLLILVYHLNEGEIAYQGIGEKYFANLDLRYWGW